MSGVDFSELKITIDTPSIKQMFVDGIRENMQMFADHYLSTLDDEIDREYFLTRREMEETGIIGFIDFVNSECVKSSDLIEDN